MTEQPIMPITGTFVSLIHNDTGIDNRGLQEWEQDFKMMKAIDMDSIIVLRTEWEQNGRHFSALDPRSTTWQEDPNLLAMIFRLSNKYGMKVYLGGDINLTNLYKGESAKVIDDNERFYEKALQEFGGNPSFHGLYVTLEALPWHFDFFKIVEGTLKVMRRLAPEKKTLLSPTFYGFTGYMNNFYTAQEYFRIYGEGLYDRIGGLLDYCAPQDKFTMPECIGGKIIESELHEWYQLSRECLTRNNIAPWGNVETFQRPYLDRDTAGYFRQADYRSLHMKLLAATPYVEKLITFEFTSCMSPNAEWGAAGRLLARYLEMIGRPTNLIKEIYC